MVRISISLLIYSETSGSRGGDLGVFGRGMMQKPFEDATYVCPTHPFAAAPWGSSVLACPAGRFALHVGELSGVVDTDSGVHIILRTG